MSKTKFGHTKLVSLKTKTNMFFPKLASPAAFLILVTTTLSIDLFSASVSYHFISNHPTLKGLKHLFIVTHMSKG